MVQTKIKNATNEGNKCVYHEIVLSPLQSKDKTQDFELSTSCMFLEVRIDTSELATDLLCIPKARQTNVETMALYAIDLIKENPEKNLFNVYIEGLVPFMIVTVNPNKKRTKVTNLEIQMIARGLFNILKFAFKSKEAEKILQRMWDDVEINHKLSTTSCIKEVIDNPFENQIPEKTIYGYVDYLLQRSSIKKYYSTDVEVSTDVSVRDCAIWIQNSVAEYAKKQKDTMKRRITYNLTQGYSLLLSVDLNTAYYLSSDYRAILMGLITHYYKAIGIEVPVPMPKIEGGSAHKEEAAATTEEKG